LNNSLLNKITLSEFSYLTFKKFSFDDFSYGFVGNFREPSPASTLEALQKELKTNFVAIPTQVHGNEVIYIDEKLFKMVIFNPVADGLIFPRERSGLFCIKTADCVPLVLVTKRCIALVHAGWKGLAQEIVNCALLKLYEIEKFEMVYAFVGPCASKKNYEVGSEVINAIGSSVSYDTISSDKFKLDLVQTTYNQVKKFCVKRTIELAFEHSQICTIENHDFYSYRREGANTGRNITFVKI
jgi:polyphenol oxidase